MGKDRNFPGSMYQRGGRWYYALSIGGKRSIFPCVIDGQKLATRNYALAVSLARRLWAKHTGAVTSEFGKVLQIYAAEQRQQICQKFHADKMRTLTKLCRYGNFKSPDDITSSIISEWLYGEGWTPKTIENKRQIVFSFCQWLIRHDYLSTNPCELVPAPKVPSREIVHLAREELDEALSLALSRDHKLHLAVALCAYAGLRLGELCRIKWEDVRQSANGPIIVLPNTKSGKPQSVPISKKLSEIISKHRKKSGHIFGGKSEFYFIDWLKPIRRQIPKLGRKGGGWHDFRRTFGSLLVQQGVPIYQVSKLLRHSNVATTAKYYAHLTAEHGRGAVDLL